MGFKKKAFVLLIFTGVLHFYSFSQIQINEVCPSNGDILYDKEFYNFPGWIELFNPSASEVDLSGYSLSNDSAHPGKWQLPPNTRVGSKGYLLIFCDGMDTLLHTNFKMDEKGGELILYDAAQKVADYVLFPKQFTNISYGRIVTSPSQWSYLSVASPGAANNSYAADERLEKPGISLPSGRYGAALGLRFTHKRSGVTVRYTTDGSEPTERSRRFEKNVDVLKTTVLKAKAFKKGFLPSETAIFTYFINEALFKLPVVSLSTSPRYLWDNMIGIYTEGENGISGNCREKPVNYNQDWERHASFQLYGIYGEKRFEQEVDFRIFGGCSRTAYQKSFALKARDKYGDNHLKHAFFSSKNINRFGALLLRNSGNDNQSSMFRDALMHTLISGQMDIDYQAYQPVRVYLNGDYWGILNLREKLDADYIEANYGVESDDIDLLEGDGIVAEGSADAYRAYMAGLQQQNLADSSAFAYIDQHIDVQEYINYMVAEIYYANTDWPGNNVKFWRQRSTNGKFRWLLWDTDWGFGLIKTTPSMASHPTLEFATDPDNVGWPNPAGSTLHFRLLLQNPVFRARFIESMNTAIVTTFRPERVIGVIDSLHNNLKGEIGGHIQRWGGSVESWNAEVQLMRDFAFYRNAFMKKHMAEFFGLEGDVKVSLQVAQNEGGYRLNNVYNGSSFQNKSYGRNIAYSLEALPKTGFSFKEYRVTRRNFDETILIDKGEVWKFYDRGNFPGANWKSTDFDDTGWRAGAARIGYGDDKEATVASYGTNRKNKHITTYFRKSFTLDTKDNLSALEASALYDDGAVIYVNGTEVYRGNMPLGEVGYNTYASEVVYGEDIFLDFQIPAEVVEEGTNIITVEVHQISGVSSDLSFDLQLKALYEKEVDTILHTEPVLAGRMSASTTFEIVFEPEANNTGVVINEFSATKSEQILDEYGQREDWIELYNAGPNTIDLNGFYISDDFSNKKKFRLLAADGSLVLGPGEFKILWADEQTSQGPHHLNFKLSAEGEEIGLYEVVGEEVVVHNEVIYDYLPDDYSMARIPDGTGPFVSTTRMTPLAENILATNDELEVLIYPNPAESYLHIKSKQRIDSIEVYDLFGRKVAVFDEVDGQPLFIYNYQQGLYIFKIISGDQIREAKVIKF